jgi:hypothetical protein
MQRCVLTRVPYPQFQRLVREIAKDMSTTYEDFRFQPCALAAMQVLRRRSSLLEG